MVSIERLSVILRSLSFYPNIFLSPKGICPFMQNIIYSYHYHPTERNTFMFKHLTIKTLSLILCLGFAAQAQAMSSDDFLAQAKYYGVNIKTQEEPANPHIVDPTKEARLDQEALDGIQLPYTPAKIYVEHNEQFTKPIMDGVVDAVSDAITFDLHNTQYEMQGLVETYKDYYNAPASSVTRPTRHFDYYKLDTKVMRKLAKAANTDFIIYADVVPLYPMELKNKDKDKLQEQGYYDYKDLEYYHGSKYDVSKKTRTSFFSKKNKLEVNLRLRVFNTKTGYFSFVSTQRLVGVAHNTSNDERAIRHSIWRFQAHENNPKEDSFFRHKSDKLHIVLN